MMQLRSLGIQQQLAQGQQQLQGLQIQQAQLQMARTKALNDAFAASVRPDGSFDQQGVVQRVAQSGQGSVLPELQKNFMELDHLKGQVQETRDKHNAAAQDYLGAAANAIRQANYDPTVAGSVFAHAASAGYGQEAQAIIQRIQQNPDSLKQIVDQVYALSPKQQTIQAQQLRAENTQSTSAETTDPVYLKAQS